MDFEKAGQLLIVYFTLIQNLRKNRNTMWQLSGIYIDFRKAYNSVRREVLYNIVIKFGIPM